MALMPTAAPSSTIWWLQATALGHIAMLVNEGQVPEVSGSAVTGKPAPSGLLLVTNSESAVYSLFFQLVRRLPVDLNVPWQQKHLTATYGRAHWLYGTLR